MENLEIQKSQKISEKYICDFCDFKCSRKSEWIIHTNRPKHQKYIIGNTLEIKKTPDRKYICIQCTKQYNTCSGLWKHKKKCVSILQDNIEEEKEKELQPTSEDINSKNLSLVLDLLKQNQDFQKQLLELSKHSHQSITNNNNNNNTNNFNLNVFLNEKCKDAMNIMDFVDSLQLQLKELEAVGKLGYVKGISNIIIRGLKELDIYKRPIHCSDVKRENLHVKSDGVWEQDSEKDKMIKAIKRVARNNQRMLPSWKEANPNYTDYDSYESDQYLKILNESAGGGSKEENDNNYNKIIRILAKEVAIDKEYEKNN